MDRRTYPPETTKVLSCIFISSVQWKECSSQAKFVRNSEKRIAVALMVELEEAEALLQNIRPFLIPRSGTRSCHITGEIAHMKQESERRCTRKMSSDGDENAPKTGSSFAPAQIFG